MTWIHLHIPKCAGTSINHALKEAFGGHTAQFDVKEFPVTTAAHPEFQQFGAALLRRPSWKAVTGHFPYGVHEFVKNGRYITVIRDPIDRAWSYCVHSPREEDFLIEVRRNGGAPLGYGPAIRSVRPMGVCNLQTRLILGVDEPQLTAHHGELAFERLRSDFSFVCLFKNIEPAWPRLTDMLGIKAALQHKNHGKQHYHPNENALSALTEGNQADLRLYALACNALDTDGKGWR